MSDATIFKDIARHAKSLDQLKDESGSYRKDMEMALNDLKTKMKEKRDMLDADEKMEDEEEKDDDNDEEDEQEEDWRANYLKQLGADEDDEDNKTDALMDGPDEQPAAPERKSLEEKRRAAQKRRAALLAERAKKQQSPNSDKNSGDSDHEQSAGDDGKPYEREDRRCTTLREQQRGKLAPDASLAVL